MSGKRIALIAGLGCAALALLLVLAIPVGFLAANTIGQTMAGNGLVPRVEKALQTIPAYEPPSHRAEPQLGPQAQPSQQRRGLASGSLTALYKQVNPGVVNIQVYVNRGMLSQGAGSGFIFDNEGHIVTNNHVVANADRVTVVFYNGIEAEARIIGTDDDSDLAVLQVDELVSGVHPLPLGDSDAVQVGEPVVAIGNPFQLGGSMTAGIVSAIGRTIPSLAEGFRIPQAIQTDAAINPGNSGGPLLNLKGEVIGVNAQIAQTGVRANAGVGFAIPSNIVRLVVPELIKKGSYQWPWLGVEGGSVGLAVMKANRLETQQGAYISRVIPGGPAARAALRGASGRQRIDGIPVPVGGDVIIEADGKPVADFSELLVQVALKKPGDKMVLTVLRDGQRRQVTVTLAPRP